ncbi:unnamed protein product [Prorocentrum cordatum]|uniref:Uncharacterized protein n=1 Tax=Prorocentrum cordatum TaxID=2364126 RepID=A0ABN9VPM4_9DINO|nr:unnamed protein product [Polarella glacialis]
MGKAAAEPSDEEEVPEWAFGEEPVWLAAVRRFLEQPGLAILDVGPPAGAAARGRRGGADGAAPPPEELHVPLERVREWGRQALADGRAGRPLAVVGSTGEEAGEAVARLRDVGYAAVANLRTRAFLARVRVKPPEG